MHTFDCEWLKSIKPIINIYVYMNLLLENFKKIIFYCS